MSRTAVAMALVLLVSGCSGLPGGSPTATGATTDPATATPTITTSETPTPTATVTRTPTPPTTAPPENVVAYANLSDRSQRVFDRALESGIDEIPLHDVPEELIPGRDVAGTEVRHLRYQGAVYEVAITDRGYRGKYALEASPINASEVGDDTRVLAYENLSARDKRRFETALSEDRTDLFRRENFTDDLGTDDVVRYRGEYYIVTVLVADVRIVSISVEKEDD